MTPEDILKHPPRVLSQDQREFYFEHGYVAGDGLIPSDVVAGMQTLAAEFVDRSREQTESGNVYDLAPGHSATVPRLRRLKRPDEQHGEFWSFATGVIADIAADLVGPDVVFHHSKLNYKWNDGGDEVRWHQDIQFYPHTNYTPLTIGLYLQDTSMQDGPLAVIPGSHAGPLFDQYDKQGQWVGCLSDGDVGHLDTSTVRYVEGSAGTITAHNCRTVHGSPSSSADDGRPLLLNAYSSADAFPYTAHPDPSAHAGHVVRGQRARWAHHDDRPCLVPPDWSGGYTSIFAAQSGEDADRTGAMM